MVPQLIQIMSNQDFSNNSPLCLERKLNQKVFCTSESILCSNLREGRVRHEDGVERGGLYLSGDSSLRQ